MVRLECETAQDWWEVEALFDLCFAPGREALSSYRLREGRDPVRDLCRIIRDHDKALAGAIRYWPVQVARQPVLLLGPVAVHPTHQGEGFGGALIRDSMARAMTLGWPRILLVGDAPYYSKFGFQRLNAVKMPPPTNPERVLGFGAWGGITGDVTP